MNTEYFTSNIETIISMLKRSIIEGAHFDYFITYTRFTSIERLSFVALRHIGCNLIGMKFIPEVVGHLS